MTVVVTLHDQINPAQEVIIVVTSITAVVPFGSGSAIHSGGDVILVAETPEKVALLLEEQ